MNAMYLHILAGLIAYMCMFILKEIKIYTFKSPLLMVLLLGIAKEVHDLFFVQHTASLLDVIYTVTGGLIGLAVCIVYREIK